MASRFGRWHPSLTLVFILLGFLFATAFSTQQRWGERPGPRKQNLLQFIKKQREERRQIENQLVAIRGEIDRLNKRLSKESGSLTAQQRQLARLQTIAGLKPVRGPGVEILIGDAPRIPPGGDPDSYLIHDYDLQIIVNALWRGGAEAISINSERLVFDTGIRSAGSTVLINSKPHGSPYRIKAIGKSESLIKSVKQDSDAALLLGEYARNFGLVYKISKKTDLRLRAHTGSLVPRTPEVVAQ